MTSHILYNIFTGRYEGAVQPMTSLDAFDRNRRLAQTGDRFRRWVPHFTAQTEDRYHARTA